MRREEEEEKVNLGNGFADFGLEEIGGVTRVPFAVTLFEFELHEVAGDGGEEHVAGLAADVVVELEDLVVAGMAIPDS